MIKLTATAYLGIALAASLGANVLLLQRGAAAAARADTRDEMAIEVATAQGRASAFAEAADRAHSMVDWARLDARILLAELRKIAQHARGRDVVYRDRVAALPELTCAPGAERQSAVNEVLQ
jgi:hypothetical protein